MRHLEMNSLCVSVSDGESVVHLMLGCDHLNMQDPFKAPYGWGTWAIAGVVLSPVVVGLTATLVSVIGYDNSVGGKGTVDGVVGMINVSTQVKI